MKISLKLCLLISLLLLATAESSEYKNSQHNTWLKKTFGEQHEALIPVVAVADMLFSCNKERLIEPVTYKLSDLIFNMDKKRLAQKLSACLKDDKMQSEIALNFGLEGCFYDQLAHLSDVERDEKMILVKKTMQPLSLNERKKSFTRCVTSQAIQYLQ
mgnify:CR=1 FL=1